MLYFGLYPSSVFFLKSLKNLKTLEIDYVAKDGFSFAFK
jgi:hypothetical protein